VGGTDRGSCPVTHFHITGVELSDPATGELIGWLVGWLQFQVLRYILLERDGSVTWCCLDASAIPRSGVQGGVKVISFKL